MYNPPHFSSSPPQNHHVSGELTRYVSAPGSFLSRAVDSVIGNNGRDEFGSSKASPSFLGRHHHQQQHQYNFSSDSSSLTCESTCKVNSSNDLDVLRNGGNQLRRSDGANEFEGGCLVRQKSSPAGFLSHLLYDNNNSNGFSITRETGGYDSHGGHAASRLKSQLSFTRGDSLSQISEGSGSGGDGGSGNGHQNSSHSYPTVSYGFESWENSISFSGPPNKRIRNTNGDVYDCLNVLETQFSMPETSLEMATVEKLLNIPEDSVPCKIRAKRGCATHPRSIAERERRTRISGRLKKLQDLVPNMDKQTSYADMLDLAVQHIKGLQNEIQKIRKEMENCTCGSKPSS